MKIFLRCRLNMQGNSLFYYKSGIMFHKAIHLIIMNTSPQSPVPGEFTLSLVTHWKLSPDITSHSITTILHTETQFSLPLTLGYQILITTPRTGINFTMLTMLHENIVQNVERVWIFRGLNFLILKEEMSTKTEILCCRWFLSALHPFYAW